MPPAALDDLKKARQEIGDKVLNFYLDLPFNTFSDPAVAASLILSSNQIETNYVDLHHHLKAGSVKSLLDVGCGGGWFTVMVEKYYGIAAHGVDFNPAVVKTARQVAATAKSHATFAVHDIFSEEGLEPHYDVVSSLGVLHHTADPFGAIERIIRGLSNKPEARLYLGLYHLYGRKPFLEYFRRLKSEGKSEAELLKAFSELRPELTNQRHLRSWFLDQVLHPHESQHTLQEVHAHLQSIGFEIVSTSINQFKPIGAIDELFAKERELEPLSYQRNVVEKKYFPGFFTVCARRLA